MHPPPLHGSTATRRSVLWLRWGDGTPQLSLHALRAAAGSAAGCYTFTDWRGLIIYSRQVQHGSYWVPVHVNCVALMEDWSCWCGRRGNICSVRSDEPQWQPLSAGQFPWPRVAGPCFVAPYVRLTIVYAVVDEPRMPAVQDGLMLDMRPCRALQHVPG